MNQPDWTGIAGALAGKLLTEGAERTAYGNVIETYADKASILLTPEAITLYDACRLRPSTLCQAPIGQPDALLGAGVGTAPCSTIADKEHRKNARTDTGIRKRVHR